MLDYDFLYVGGLYVLIKSTVGINDHDRSARAKSEATRHDEFYFAVKLVVLKYSFEFGKNLLGCFRTYNLYRRKQVYELFPAFSSPLQHSCKYIR